MILLVKDMEIVELNKEGSIQRLVTLEDLAVNKKKDSEDTKEVRTDLLTQALIEKDLLIHGSKARDLHSVIQVLNLNSVVALTNPKSITMIGKGTSMETIWKAASPIRESVACSSEQPSSSP